MELSPAKRALLEKWLQGRANHDATVISQRPLNSHIPLSFPQQRQLFLEILEQNTAVNNLSVFLELKGELNLVSLEKSVNKIVARHDSLRTQFSFSGGIPTPEVLADLMINLPIVDLQGTNEIDQMNQARRIAEKEVLMPFDLTRAPLIRLRLYTLGSGKKLLLIVVHHTIADGWSLGVFLQELFTFYKAITLDKLPPVAELPIQYTDFAYWQTDHFRKGLLQSSMNYWTKQLAGELPVLQLPTHQQRSTKQTFSGGTHRFELSAELIASLEKLCRQEDTTLFMTLLTAFTIMLYRYSGQDDILIGTPVSNRNLPELANMIGVFINTIVLRTNLSDNPGFRALLKRIRKISLEAYAHQDLPFEQLVENLKPVRDLSRTPIFQVVFNMQNSPMPKLEIPGLEIGFLEINRGVSQFELTMIMSRCEGKYQGAVEYNDSLFKPTAIARMFQSFQMILKEAIAQPDCAIAGLPIISKEELFHLIYGLNQTKFDFPHELCVHQLFEAQVERTPEAVAVIHNDTAITYLELNYRANVLAKRLRAFGVGPGIPVGILMKKSLEIVEVLLAVLKAGGSYVPMHTSFPKDRVEFIMKDAGVQLVVTNVDFESTVTDKVHVVNLNEDKSPAITECSNAPVNIASTDPAYIIYTSGSTGRPKGVMVQHSALVNFLWSMRLQPGMTGGDVLLSVTSISFDIAALELFLPLTVGATVVMASEEITSNPYQIGQAIIQYHVNIMQATPATWQLLLEAGWEGRPDLKALCGGEAMTRTLADQLLDRVGSLWNMYGPTETTVWSSVSKIERGDSPITIGKPIGNTQLYVLDNFLQPQPIGVIGQLHIGGEGLSLGYLNYSDLTNLKFIPDCFSAKHGARLYRTGDNARYLSDYSIELLGRMDDQVKINGHRIELGEISAILMEHPSIHQAIVIAHSGKAGEKGLIAYLVPNNDKNADTVELQEFLKQKLPYYMIPALFVCIDFLPLTSSGKVDRNALPAPGNICSAQGYVAPQNKVEQILAGIWQDVLDKKLVGIHDNFFDLGGASIQSIQIVAKANVSGLRITVENVFEFQTIAGLAAHING